ncbi:hypothetical protein [Paenibacillus polymyxa]|uniref:Uncharacterized protein n=1 Tax=Paenibacillus polymyxa TaxID=1406 RepID=A0AAP4A2X1_PAEPO|nr:hypothetical protein [Paenibacillus polymyxa]MDH2334272.1 hypothetical protein [Paenibacillus polymyxa]
MSRFPVHGNTLSELQHHRRMETSFSITETGRLDAFTKTWTADPWKGFTGTVIVFLITDEQIIHATEPHSYGVDGVRVGDPSREDYWYEDIPIDVVEKMNSYAIWHAHTPIDRVTPDKFKEWAEAIGPFIQVFTSPIKLHSTEETRKVK